MSQITLVRHGQANTTARDEASYDRLSDLGHQQAAWLGGYFRNSNERYARAYSGTLLRHRQTLQAMDLEFTSDPVVDERLNEVEYFTLATLFEEQHNVPLPGEREEFVRHLPKMFAHWRDGKIEGAPESFDDFRNRTQDALAEISEGEGPALVVTSGGLIGMAMMVTMRLDLEAMAHLCLSIENTSVHRLQKFPSALAPVQFNACPHLDSPERRLSRTHL
ncbi:MAG: histidine phosphatase family protein [Thalassococcus sp.]|uniref:histidine phosphatase family protein n=1 Tax=Thalassococcus sp. TaxID=1928858 RepID=UPI001B296539|nr:histidine phosphatase family protein [Thalassococcus sp.]MBO6866382.1 histidine phosphatase family protein [Thalassococcus sp.]